jgi:hypothetical protein
LADEAVLDAIARPGFRRFALSDAPQPIVRLTVAMHPGNDQNLINLDRVGQRAREHLGQTTTDVCLEDASNLWRLRFLSNGCLAAPNEP